MPFQPVPNAALVTIEGRVDNQLTILDLSFGVSGGTITAASLGLLLTGVESFVEFNLAPLLSSDWSSQRLVAIDLANNFGARVVLSAVHVGGVDEEAAPNNVAATVSFNTGLRGRSFRGRNYVPGIPNSVITLNTLDPEFIAALIAAYQSLVGAGTFVLGWQFGVVSREIGGVVRAEGIITPVLTAEMTTNTVRSMRSREVGHGA